MGEIDIRRLKWRQWAHPFDHRIAHASTVRGHDPSPEAIDGFYGCQWDEAFLDRSSSEAYVVTCYDGANRSKGAYRPEDEKWMQRMQNQIVARTKREAQDGATRILLSAQEWALMSGRMFQDWFDRLPGEWYKTVADGNRYRLDGEVGTVEGVPVVIDPQLPNPLGDPPSDVHEALQRELERIDREEDLAESFGY